MRAVNHSRLPSLTLVPAASYPFAPNRPVEAVLHLKSQGYQVWAMETTSKSEVYTNVRFPQPVRTRLLTPH